MAPKGSKRRNTCSMIKLKKFAKVMGKYNLIETTTVFS